jgi:hypothetical protein
MLENGTNRGVVCKTNAQSRKVCVTRRIAWLACCLATVFWFSRLAYLLEMNTYHTPACLGRSPTTGLTMTTLTRNPYCPLPRQDNNLLRPLTTPLPMQLSRNMQVQSTLMHRSPRRRFLVMSDSTRHTYRDRVSTSQKPYHVNCKHDDSYQAILRRRHITCVVSIS